MDRSTKLIGFLQDDLGVEAQAVAIAQRTANPNLDLLHLVLWQLGLISLEQVQQTFEWLEEQPLSSGDR